MTLGALDTCLVAHSGGPYSLAAADGRYHSELVTVLQGRRLAQRDVLLVEREHARACPALLCQASCESCLCKGLQTARTGDRLQAWVCLQQLVQQRRARRACVIIQSSALALSGVGKEHQRHGRTWRQVDLGLRDACDLPAPCKEEDLHFHLPPRTQRPSG